MSQLLTFAKVSQVLLQYTVNGYTQKEYINHLFKWGLDQELIFENEVETNQSNKWIKGKRAVTSTICRIYVGEDGIKRLQRPIEECLIPNLYDIYSAVDKVEGLIYLDDSIHPNKQKELSQEKEQSLFLAKVIQFVLLRDRDKKDKKVSANVASRFVNVHIPMLSGVFLGREKECNELHTLLQKNKAIFVTGIAGIGKSELVREYVRLHEIEYENIIYLTYEESLEYTIQRMTLSGEDIELSEKRRFESHYRILQGLDKDSIVIVDNFDILPENDKLFRKFINHKFRVLFTTRTNIKRMPILELEEISDREILLKLFRTYYNYDVAEEEVILDIIEEVHSHTLMIELIARTLQAGNSKPRELLGQLISHGIHIKDENEVTIVKDENDRTELMYEHILLLFRINQLTEVQLDDIMHLSLMPLSGVYKDLLATWRKKNENNSLNGLIRLGWIKEEESTKRLFMHPVIRDVSRIYTEPTVTKCELLLNSIKEICMLQGLDIPYYQMLFSCIMSVIEQIQVDDTILWVNLLSEAFCYMDKYGNYSNMSGIVKEMDLVIHSSDRIPEEKIALVFNYKAQLAFEKKDFNKAIKLQRKALKIVSAICHENADLHSNLCNNMAVYYTAKGYYRDALNLHIKAISISREYNCLVRHDTIEQIYNIGFLILKIDLRTNDYLNYLIGIRSFAEMYINKDSSDYGRMIMVVGLIHIKMGEIDIALEELKEAENLLVKYLPPDAVTLNSLYYYMGCTYQLLGQKEDEVKYKEKYRNYMIKQKGKNELL